MNDRPGQAFSDAKRTQKRHASGARLILSWGLVLTLLVVIYLVASAIITHFQYRNWSYSINQALREGDAVTVAALLTACKREVPALAEKPQFAVWQSRLLELQENNSRKHAVFERKLDLLQQKLDDPATDHVALLLELAEVAAYAVTAEELELLRNLQLRCETLIRQRELALSGDGVKALREIEKLLKELQLLQERNLWEDFRKQSELCSKAIARVAANYQKLPEITSEAEKMRLELQKMLAAAADHERAFLESERAFAEIFDGVYPEEIARRSRDFLQRYSSTPRAGAVKTLLSDLARLERVGKRLSEQENALLQRSGNALEILKLTLPELAENYLDGTIFELALQSDDKVWFLFATGEKARFNAVENGQYQIQFRDVNGVQVFGSFDKNGNGSLVVGNLSLTGKLKAFPANEVLPEALYQKELIRIMPLVQLWSAEEFPARLEELKKFAVSEVLPEKFRAQLLQIIAAAEKELDCPVEEFVFRKKIAAFSLKNTPVFAGIVYRSSTGNRVCTVGDLSPDTLIYYFNGKTSLVMQKKLSIKNLAQCELFAVEEFAILTRPADNADLSVRWQDFAREAKKHNWQLPEPF